ncbi:sensor histidine kinase [Actinomadura opuntiae]|uniref:sensor histidine kinase n=1 Tax=Actinomadura sp. OS1-43 TaxID=604315 RepID=UPI00255B3250|nr:histidine kinase [Actinomadura sp. OS1-43]MDL4815530.1 histidine kinase [Actinomadura sp. OS1-43]
MIDFRRLPGLWERYDVTVRDLPLGLLLVAMSLVPSLHGVGTQLGYLPDRPFDALGVAAVALECLPLAVRRRWPDVCLALVAAGFAIDQLRGYHTVAGTALPIVLISTGAHLERSRRPLMAVASAAYVVLAVALERQGAGEGVEGYVTFYLALCLAWGAGAWLRSTRAAEAERRRHVAEATRTAERTRIARELHDVVTHHVTAMVVQAEAARYLTAAPDRLEETLTAVSDTGRRAITDLRHLLDLLNPDHTAGAAAGGRTASTGDIAELVDQTRRAGQPVEFVRQGEPAEPAGGAEFVAYRVVQEALTNALKYAHGSATRVRVRHAEKEITVEIANDGSGSRTRSPGGGGRGLTGLRERVEALDGDFTAGPGADGGFAVTARIPTGSRS